MEHGPYFGSDITNSSSTINKERQFASKIIQGLNLLKTDSTPNHNDTINTWFIEHRQCSSSSGSNNANQWDIEESSKIGSQRQVGDNHEIADEDEQSGLLSHDNDCVVDMHDFGEKMDDEASFSSQEIEEILEDQHRSTKENQEVECHDFDEDEALAPHSESPTEDFVLPQGQAAEILQAQQNRSDTRPKKKNRKYGPIAMEVLQKIRSYKSTLNVANFRAFHKEIFPENLESSCSSEFSESNTITTAWGIDMLSSTINPNNVILRKHK